MSGSDVAADGSPEDRLLSAAQMYKQAAGRPGLKLEALLHSVIAVTSLLRRDHDLATLPPLQYLSAALSRLAAGHSDPVLRPLREKGQSGRPAPDGALKFKQVNILLAVEVLLRAKWRKGDAFKRVAEMASAAGFTSADGKRISPHMIRNWRDTLSSHPNMHDVGQMLDAQAVMLLDELDSSNAEHAAEQMLIAVARGFEGIEISKNPPLT